MKQRLQLLYTIVFVGLTSAFAADPAEINTAPRPREGWTMQLVAEAPLIRHPSVVCAAPDGRVFVAEDPMDISSPHAHVQEGRIVCLFPDGRATTFATNLYAVFGLQYLEGKLYVLHNPRFSVFTDGDGVGRDRIDLIEQTNPEPWALDWNDHVPANFRLAMDGYFYVAVGDKGLYGAVDRSGHRVDLHGGGVVRIRPDGTQLEVVCSGVRNILDVAINEEDELFTYDNTDEHQWMGRLTHMVDGGFYGYPFDFIPRRPSTLWMLADYGPGAATGALAWNDDSLPPAWRGNLILADFGQRNLRRVRLERAGATFRAVEDELLFPNPPPDFRPVGITETADGAGILICDWQHADNKDRVAVGRLWKLTSNFTNSLASKPKWYLPAALGQPFHASIDDLTASLSHPQKGVRLTVQRALSQRGVVAVPALTRLLTNATAPANARWHALWALDQIDGGVAARRDILALAAASTSAIPASVARQAIRQLKQRHVREALPLLIERLRDPDASMRFHAATALRRVGDATALSPLLGLSAEPDPFVRFAVFTTLNQLGRRHPELWQRLVRALEIPDSFARETVSFALRETFDPDLVKELAEAASDRTRPVPAREVALRLLAKVHHQPPPWKGGWWAYHPALGQPPARTADWSGTPLVLATLRDLLDDAEPTLRLGAVEGLREASDKQSSADVREQFNRESDNQVRLALLVALGDFADAASAPMLANLLRNPPAHPALLSTALATAGKLAAAPETGSILPSALTNLLAGPSLATPARVAALDALGEFKIASAEPWFVRFAQSGNASERAAALRGLVRLGGTVSLKALRPLLKADSPEIRRDAVAALGRSKQRDAVPDLLAAWQTGDTHDVAIEALTELPDLRALDAYIAGLASTNTSLRDKSRRAVGNIATAALPLLQERRAELAPGVLSELRRVYAQDPTALASPLFASVPRPTESADYERFALTHDGDPRSGQEIFANMDGVACLRCHAVAGRGGAIGPDLTTIGAQFGRAALIDSILYPSKAVREGYQQYAIELKDGESITGAVRSESADTLTIMDAEGRVHELRKTSIKERRGSALSLMPEGLQVALSVHQFADLIAYVESLRTDPRRKDPNSPR